MIKTDLLMAQRQAFLTRPTISAPTNPGQAWEMTEKSKLSSNRKEEQWSRRMLSVCVSMSGGYRHTITQYNLWGGGGGAYMFNTGLK